MKLLNKTFLFILIFLLISGCSSPTSIPTSSPTSLPSAVTGIPDVAVSTPTLGLTTVVGRFVSATTGKPFAFEYVALAEIHRNDQGGAAWGLNTRTTPQTSTDEEGYFKFENIPAREYAVIAGDPMIRSLALNDLTTGDVKIWTPQPDQILDVGELKFEFNTK